MNSSSSLRHGFQVGDFHPSSSFGFLPRLSLVAPSVASIPWGRGTSRDFPQPGPAPPAAAFFLPPVPSAFPLHRNVRVLHRIPQSVWIFGKDLIFKGRGPVWLSRHTKSSEADGMDSKCWIVLIRAVALMSFYGRFSWASF